MELERGVMAKCGKKTHDNDYSTDVMSAYMKERTRINYQSH